MHGFLKCYYGYQNLWDELLFWWILDYIDTTYPRITTLTIEVGDRDWMAERWDRNIADMISLKLALGFAHQEKTIEFIERSKNLADNFRYDMYFFWGGEVFAESRGLHGGRNYLLRYPFVILRKNFVLLWGIETAHKRRQKLLYRIVLPRARRIICREKTSFEHVRHYSKKTALYTSDFAIPVIHNYKTYCSGYLAPDAIQQPYLILNLISSMSTEENYAKIEQFIWRYDKEYRLVYLSWKSINSDDQIYARWLGSVYPQVINWDRTQHTVLDLLSLVEQSEAGLASRLHILLLLQEFNKDRYALVYAQKVSKLITSTLEL